MKAHGCLALFAAIHEGIANHFKYSPGHTKWVSALACSIPLANTDLQGGSAHNSPDLFKAEQMNRKCV